MPPVACKCIECGFLAVHDEEGRDAFEAGKETRTSGARVAEMALGFQPIGFVPQRVMRFLL